MSMYGVVVYSSPAVKDRLELLPNNTNSKWVYILSCRESYRLLLHLENSMNHLFKTPTDFISPGLANKLRNAYPKFMFSRCVWVACAVIAPQWKPCKLQSLFVINTHQQDTDFDFGFMILCVEKPLVSMCNTIPLETRNTNADWKRRKAA